MLRFAALVSGFGWHVQDLRRAAAGLDVELRLLLPTIVGRVGVDSPPLVSRGLTLLES